MSEQHAIEEESEDFKLMRRYDREWNAPRFLQIGALTLIVSIVIIYVLAQMGSGSKSPPNSLLFPGVLPSTSAH